MDLPVFQSSSNLLNAAFRIAAGDLVGNIQPFQDGLLDSPQPCILAGLEYDTPWTRDAAINVWNGAGLIFPQASRSTLLSVLEKRDGRTFIGGQYWDAIIWTTGAWAYYLYTGDRDMLALTFEATCNSLEHFERTEFNPQTGLFRGPACYGDGVAAYPDLYAQTGGSSSILDWPAHNPDKAAPTGEGIPMQALSTNCLYYNAYRLLDEMARELGQPADPTWGEKASALKEAINEQFWDASLGRYCYLVDEWGGSERQEGLGNCFVVLFGIAPPERAQQVVQKQIVSPNGIPCVWPTFSRYVQGEHVGRHAGTVWPHVQGFWAETAARAGESEKLRFELFKLAELAVRDGMFAEIYHPISGEVYGGLQEGRVGWLWHSCRRQTWSATGFLRMILLGLIGMNFSPGGVTFRPNLPEGLPRLSLRGLLYRRQSLNLTLIGQGQQVLSFILNGERQEQPFLPAHGSGEQEIEITLG